MSGAGQDEGVWQEQIRLHSYDVDFARRPSLEAICRLFLEAAWNHAEALGVGFAHLAQQQRLWVLARLLLKIDHYPGWGDTVVLKTWPRPARSVFALREFQLLKAGGQMLGGGSSAWVVLDANTKKPQRIEMMLNSIRQGPDHLAVGIEPAKVASCAGPVVLTTTTRYSDVDLNGHVNSGRYIGWLLDSYPFEFHQVRQAQLLEINYLGETRGGEALSIHALEQAPGTWAHAIFKNDGTEVCRARLVWGNRERPDL